MSYNPSLEEQAAASVVAALSGKRARDGADAAGGFNPNKFARVAPALMQFLPQLPEPANFVRIPLPGDNISESMDSADIQLPELQAAPYYFYKDFSQDMDPDPLTPLTPPGRVPNFPAKMHAILSRPDLADVIAWMPHGRSWRVLKPREFEVRVLPTFFEHSKFSSFIRQANGWGFRRITQGRDRNSYYHDLFLRGLPHLCKQMKRPGVSEKRPADVDHEPDLYAISDCFPVPEKADDDSIMLECTVQGGPKARMPIYAGAILSAESLRLIHGGTDATFSAASVKPKEPPPLFSFKHYNSASDSQICMPKPQEHTLPSASTPHGFFVPQNSFATSSVATPNTPYNSSVDIGSSTATNVSFVMPTQQHASFQNNASVVPDASNFSFQSSCAASQFAAGFAAATALSSSHIRNVLGQALAVNQSFQQFQQAPAPALMHIVNQPGQHQHR